MASRSHLSILLLTRSLEIGGAEKQLTILAKELHRRGHGVAVATFYLRGPLIRELNAVGVPIIDLEKSGKWDLLGFLGRLLRVLGERRPNIVYSFLGGANIMAALARIADSRFNLVWSIRSAKMDLDRYEWTHAAAYRVEALLSRKPDLIIANSSAGKEYALANGFNNANITIIPNGIDTAKLRPSRDLRQQQRNRWGMDPGVPLIGVMARLDPMKGHAIFLEAASMLARRRDDVRFVFLGDGPEEERLRDQAKKLGLCDRVIFAGFIENVTEALNALDICCSASVGEGFSNAIAEAMACGVPCVVTDVGDSRLIVGDTGTVVPPNDHPALAHALDLALADLVRPNLEPRARIQKLFSVKAMADATIHSFRNLLTVQ